MRLPKLMNVRNMSLKELDEQAKKLALGEPGETYQATANRLYTLARDEQAYVYQQMALRSSELRERTKGKK